MIRVTKRVHKGESEATLELPLEIRVRARFKANLTDGRDVGESFAVETFWSPKTE